MQIFRCVFGRQQPQHRRRLRQAQRGRDLLVAHASGAPIFSMVNNSSAEWTISHAKMFVNTWYLRQMMLWCTDLVSCAWLCSSVQCRKTYVLSHSFKAWCIIHQEGHKFEDVHDGLGPSFSIPRFSQEKETSAASDTRKKGCPKRKRASVSRTACMCEQARFRKQPTPSPKNANMSMDTALPLCAWSKTRSKMWYIGIQILSSFGVIQ